MGGKVLTVEAIQYSSSRQKIQVTGQLGDVMKESVDIAFSWIKSHLDSIAITGNYNQELTNVEKIKYL
jgi:ATP-dependent Lon protease